MTKFIARRPYASAEERLPDNPFANRTAIICTISKATVKANAESTLREMAKAGMTIARFNFAKINEEDRQWFWEQYSTLRRLEEELGFPIGVMVDLAGPKLRLGPFHSDFWEDAEGKRTKMTLKEGDHVRLTLDPVNHVEGESEECKHLIQLLGMEKAMPRWTEGEGTRVVRLGDDEFRRLRLVARPNDRTIVCEAIDHKTELHATDGITFADIDLSSPDQQHTGIVDFPRKDMEDLEFILAQKPPVDFISVSFASKDLVEKIRHSMQAFARRQEDVDETTRELVGSIWLVAKVETPAVADSIDDLLASPSVDAVMIARGDLAQAVTMFHLPGIQSRILSSAHHFGKPSIVATGLLGTSRIVGKPTIARSEASEITQVLGLGAHALLLAETSDENLNPVEEIKILRKMMLRAEANLYSLREERDIAQCPFIEHQLKVGAVARLVQERDRFIDRCICRPAIGVAERSRATVIAATVTTGRTICVLSRHLPVQFVLALCKRVELARRTLLCRGVLPYVVQTHDIHNLHDPSQFHRALVEAVTALQIDKASIECVLREQRYKDQDIAQAIRLVGGDLTGRESVVIGIMKADFSGDRTKAEPAPNTIHVLKLD